MVAIAIPETPRLDPPIALPKDSELADLMVECYRDTRKFCVVFFPHWFFKGFGPLHDEIFGIIDDPNIRRYAIAAPRERGKTTINTALLGKDILYHDARYEVAGSCSEKKAMESTENLKFELVSNELIQKCFGSMKNPESWSMQEWVTSTGVKVLPRGMGQQIRGLNYRGSRPNRFIIDDVESDEMVENEERREKCWNWLNKQVINSVDSIRGDWRVGVIGTVLHEDSVLSRLFEDSRFVSVRLQAMDDDLQYSLWPEAFSHEQMREEVAEARKNGVIDEFYQEKMNLPISTKDSSFKKDYFQYYDETEVKLGDNAKVESVVFVDPNKVSSKTADEGAIVGVGFELDNSRIYVRDVEHGHFKPDELIDRGLSMCMSIRAHTLAIEVTSLHEHVTQPIQNEIIRKGLNIQVEELKARGKKEDRIQAMQPYYKRMQVYHNPAVCGALEAQLLSFPKSRRDDIMDALAYFVQFMSIGGKFFHLTSDEMIVTPEEEYEKLAAICDAEDDWRFI